MKRLIAAAAVALIAGHASATTVNFSGIVTTGFGGVVAGQTLNGSYDFDPTTTARAGSTSTQAVFDALTALNFSVTGGAITITGASGAAPEIQVDNNPPAPFTDRYGVTSRASDGLFGTALGGFDLDTFLFRMDDSTNSVFSDALVLPTAPNLADFDSSAFFIFYKDSAGALGIISGELNSLTTVPQIPLPAALPLALSGLASLGLLGWRRRRASAA